MSEVGGWIQPGNRFRFARACLSSFSSSSTVVGLALAKSWWAEQISSAGQMRGCLSFSSFSAIIGLALASALASALTLALHLVPFAFSDGYKIGDGCPGLAWSGSVCHSLRRKTGPVRLAVLLLLGSRRIQMDRNWCLDLPCSSSAVESRSALRPIRRSLHALRHQSPRPWWTRTLACLLR